jgi:phenylalanyl-tRNA synthetase beta chain
VLPDERKFVPLGFDKEVTLNEILTLHPKGKEYAYILENIDKYPFLEDSQGAPLSFPPIINSRLTGEVCVGDDELFCELTGTDIEQLLLVVNIFAENLKDRGAKIYPCATKYPYSTPFGDNIITPYDFKLNIKLNPTELNKLLGTDFSVSKIKLHLEAMGYTLSCQEETPDSTKNDKIIVSVPSYRRDVMHPVDIIEDFAISVGYNYFKPTPLTEFTVGKTTSIQPLISKVRNIMIGSGFEEVISNILTSKSILFSNIGITNEEVVEVQNPVSESYTVLRNSIIPILLNIEAKNSQSAYPHHIFEIGEVVVPDANSPTKFRTEFKVSALICHASANFSELHSFMDTLLYYLGIPYKIDKISHPSFITGRVGNIITECAGNVGIIGEIHPAVLDNLKIKCPVATFELPLNFSLDSLQDIAI